MMNEEVIPVELDTVYDETAKVKARGFRFVTMTCVDVDESRFEVLYHFDKDLTMKHFRLTVPKGRTVPSISPVYLAAFLVENEIQGLYGLMFDGLVLDYGQSLYLEEEVQTTPFCKYTTHTAPEEN